MESLGSTTIPFEEFSTEVRKLFHRLKAAAEDLHLSATLPIPQRAILEDLSALGPQTVPQMARSRPVSRQHIQKLVNQLLEQQFVEMIANPAHKTSMLVRLTNRGRKTFEKMKTVEQKALINLPLPFPFPAKDLITATHVLRSVRQYLEGPDWHQFLLQLKEDR